MLDIVGYNFVAVESIPKYCLEKLLIVDVAFFMVAICYMLSQMG
jgi:hypothetical protein